ncbi:testis-expressed protein 264-like [Salvelinus alpinus]|uniref:testis-expressed protein 264-like n=1 Tax=Salvelinus alpinus TaxID=8036 RepID=UPI0039FCDF30
MSDSIILALIVFLMLCLIVTVVAAVVYSGLFTEVNIKTGSPYIKNVTIAYKLHKGPYKDCGGAFTETVSIGPKLNTIRVSYDDSTEVPDDQCRYIIGSILSEGDEKPDEELQKLYEKFGFNVLSFPEVSLAVTTTFPSTTPLSHWLAPYRVYPELRNYIMERQLHAWPFIEINTGDLTHYIAPLSSQSGFHHTGFVVPELVTQIAAKTPVTEESLDQDRGTDISGAESHSDVSSKLSSQAQSKSTETSLAPSSASSLSHRDQGDGVEQGPGGEHRESSEKGHGDRGSSESVGSGSSFEELDLVEEMVEELEIELGREEEGPTVKEEAREAPVEAVAEEREPVGDGEE